jgi:kumamolisin
MAEYVALQGSERQPLPGARAVGPADPREKLQVSLILRRASGGDAPVGRTRREDFAREFGARAADIDAVTAFATAHGLSTVEANQARRVVVLSGTVAAFNAAFRIELLRFECKSGTYRGMMGPVRLPADLVGIVEAVFGLDDRPAAVMGD